MQRREFLDALWPPAQSGLRCVAWKVVGKPGFRHDWLNDNAKADAKIAKLDADPDVEAVYHACGLYDERIVRQLQEDDKLQTGRAFSGKGRVAGAVSSASALWLDMDVGKDGGYATLADAREGVNRLTAAFAPPSIVVMSGAGLHLYWLLEAPVSLAQWQDMGERLKALCKQHGILQDPTRTADPASILRPPGTTNRKHGTVVAARRLGPALSTAWIADTLQPVAVQEVRPTFLPLAGGGDDLTANVYPKTYVKGVLRGCQQIARSVLARGANDAEPMWTAVLRTLSAADDCTDALLHKVSDGHPGYDAGACQQKIDHVRDMAPARCSAFEELAPGGCDGCPYRGSVESPIVLGQENRMEGPKAVELPAAGPTTMSFVLPEPEPTDVYRFDIADTPSGPVVRYQEKVKDDTGRMVWSGRWKVLSSALYWPIGRRRDAISGIVESVYKVKLPMDDIVEVVVPMASLVKSDGFFSFLGSAGVHVSPHDKQARGAHVAYNNAWWQKLTRDMPSTIAHDTYGWVRDEQGQLRALVAAMQYNMDGTIEEPALTGNALSIKQFVRMQGSLDGWKEAALVFCRPGHEISLVTILATLFSPFTAANNGVCDNPAAISLYSNITGAGKTSTLEVAASAWFDPRLAKPSSDSTKPFISRTMMAMRDLPLMWDEVTEADPTTLINLVYNVPNGQGRGTSSQTGKVILPPNVHCQVVVTTNNPLRGVVAEEKQAQQEAPQARLVEWTMQRDPHLQRQLMTDNPIRRTAVNFGHAGDWWARYLLGAMDNTNRMNQLIDRYIEARRRIEQQVPGDNSYRFFASMAGAAIVGAMYIEETGFLPIKAADVEAFVLGRLLPMQRAAMSVQKNDLLDIMCQFIADNQLCCVSAQVIRPMDAVIVNNVSTRIRSNKQCHTASVTPHPERFRGSKVMMRFEKFLDQESTSPTTYPAETRLLVERKALKAYLKTLHIDVAAFEDEGRRRGWIVDYLGSDNMSATPKPRAFVALNKNFVDNPVQVDCLVIALQDPRLNAAVADAEEAHQKPDCTLP